MYKHRTCDVTPHRHVRVGCAAQQTSELRRRLSPAAPGERFLSHQRSGTLLISVTISNCPGDATESITVVTKAGRLATANTPPTNPCDIVLLMPLSNQGPNKSNQTSESLARQTLSFSGHKREMRGIENLPRTHGDSGSGLGVLAPATLRNH